MKRRTFIQRSSQLAALSVAGPHISGLNTSLSQRPQVCIFSKHLQWLDFSAMGKYVNALGFDGVDLTVRRGGHVLPEEAESVLPKAVEQITRQGVSVPMMATNIKEVESPYAERILKTASEAGITHYRMAYYGFDKDKSIPQNLKEIRKKVLELTELNEKYGIYGAYQNHAGTYLGASIWDIWELLKDLDSPYTGIQFDVRHATVEGGFSWVTDLKLVHPYINCSVIKDFYWAKDEEKDRWYVKNVPVGEGMVDFDTYFKFYKEYNLSGPISLHIEYPLFPKEIQSSEERKTTARPILTHDLQAIHSFLANAGIDG